MSMKVVIALLAITMTTCLINVSDKKESYILRKFNEHNEHQNKTYATVEEKDARFRVFANNYLRMENQAINNDDATYTIAMNKFADLSPKEFKRTYANLKISVSDYSKKTQDTGVKSNGEVPSHYDWTTKGVATKAKDQGSCGSCWAFSTIGNLEALHHIRDGDYKGISEQELVDCDKVDEGCNGGLMENALQYAIDGNGIMKSEHYPYKARRGTCQTTEKVKYAQVARYHKFEQVSEDQLTELIATHGPMSIAINADPLQWYSGGVINDDASECDPDALDHAVLVVGYTPDYWIVRNSWGANWGEHGFFRLARGQNTCGVLNYITSAVLP